MSTIWRFALPITDTAQVSMPAGSLLLSVGPPRGPEMYSNDGLDLWAIVDPAAPPELRDFRVVGTGNPMPDDCGLYVGSTHSHGGALIWHVFEARPERNTA